MARPKITISNFRLMNENGLYFSQGFDARKINGETILSPAWFNTFVFSEDTTGFTNFREAEAFTSATHSSTDRILMMSQDRIFDYSDTNPASFGEIHQSSDTASTKPDIKTTTDNALLYTTQQFLGIGRFLKATGGSTTTVEVTDGQFTINGYEDENFTTMGYAAGDKLYNFTNSEEYTIAGGGVANNTLTLDSGTAIAADDLFILFDDNYQDLVTDNASLARQIALIGDDYWILNDNYLASLNIDLTTFAAQAKQLPYGIEGTCMGANSSSLLIGGILENGGKLMLWDTTSDGFANILSTDKVPEAIIKYREGWIISMGARLHYTDGYQISELTRYPDTERYFEDFSPTFNGLEIVDDKIIVAMNLSRGTRARNGIGIYSINNGWTYVPFDNNAGTSGGTVSSSLSAKAVFQHISFFNFSTIYCSYQDINATAKYGVNKLRDAGEGISEGNYSAIFYIKLPEKMRLSTIELNLAPKYDLMNSVDAVDTTVTVNYGDARAPLWNYNQVLEASTASTIKVGNSQGQGRVGQQVELRSADLGGQRRYIASIADAGTSDETWTLDTAFSGTPVTSIDIVRTNLYKAESKTISNDLVDNSLVYNISNFYSDKIYIEVVMDSTTKALDIHSISIS